MDRARTVKKRDDINELYFQHIRCGQTLPQKMQYNSDLATKLRMNTMRTLQ
jgi:hypothetical protein